MASKAPTFYEEITAATQHFREFGFRSQNQLDEWVARIRRAALLQLKTPAETERVLKRALTERYSNLITKAGVLKTMPEVSRFTLDKLKPQLRKELDRRILASANLIKLNRAKAIDTTLSRFQGWATAIPAGGSNAPEARADKELMRKALARMPFEERRVIIDQSHKMIAALRDTVAVGGGALAGIWHSPWRRPGYQYREDHKERDEQWYAIRDNWAIEKGLMKPGSNGYLDSIDGPGFLPFCSCSLQYVFSLNKLPPDMLTKAGMYGVTLKSTAPQS